MTEKPFNGFVLNDFSAFRKEKQENPRFDDERKIVWKKMKHLQSCLDMELKRRGFALEGKVSQYWINYTKHRVNGIRLAYTEIKPYYSGCQLNCGIYEESLLELRLTKKPKLTLTLWQTLSTIIRTNFSSISRS